MRVTARERRERNLVVRADGKTVNVVRKVGHLFICETGCCCGVVERGYAPVDHDLYYTEWERRKLRNRVHLTHAGCLGPCTLANVAMLLFDGRAIWFHSVNSPSLVLAIFDYIDAMLAANRYLPPPAALADHHFTAFDWADASGELVPAERTARRAAPATPAAEAPGFLFLSHADTDLLALDRALAELPADFPPVRAANPAHLRSDADVDAFLDAMLPGAEVVVLRLLGGRSSFPRGFDRLVEDARATGRWLIVLPGTDALDPELTAASNAGVPVAHEVHAYLRYGGVKNWQHMLRFLSDHLLATGFGFDAPEPQPEHGVYHPDLPPGSTVEALRARHDPARPTIGILFYRAHLLSGNTAFVDALVREIEARGANALPVFAYSLKETDRLPAALRYFLEPAQARAGLDAVRAGGTRALDRATSGGSNTAGADADGSTGRAAVDVVISTLSFAMGGINAEGPTPAGWSVEALTALDVPVVQAIAASGTRAAWDASARGLSPLDTAMNVALPEFDGRIIGVPISFKETLRESPHPGPVSPHPSPSPILKAGAGEQHSRSGNNPEVHGLGQGEGGVESRTVGAGAPSPAPSIGAGVGVGAPPAPRANGHRRLDAPVVGYAPIPDRVARTVGLALRLAALRRKPNAEKRVAFVLTNSPAKAARIGNAVGLDAPASLLRLFEAMRAAGYRIAETPASGDELMHALIDRCSYDTEFLTEQQLALAAGRVPERRYQGWFEALPERVRGQMVGRWGRPPGEAYVHAGHLALAGLDLGNVFLALQPPRGYGMDPNAIYHTPDLPPTHNYHALYRWLRDEWGADAIVHVGKHGTLEWLPGKGVGLSGECYPDLFLDDLPLVYPFIINNPGEGAQAKRRTHAVIVDHMTPPMTTAEGYGELAELAQLVDEYYQVEQLDPSKLPLLQQQIWELLKRARLDSDLKLILTREHDGHTHEWDEDLLPDGTPASLGELRGKDFAHLLEDIDGYLCELTGAQIRGGLHILGDVPAGDSLVDLLQSLTRLPNLDVPSLREAVATALGFDLDALLARPGARLQAPTPAQAAASPQTGAQTHALGPETTISSPPALGERLGEGAVPSSSLHSHADALRLVDARCRELLAALAAAEFDSAAIEPIIAAALPACGGYPAPAPPDAAARVARTLRFVGAELMPKLRRNTDEIEHVLRALDGRYVPAGPSGAPTRGMAHVLPTGRNFYAVDPRALPSLAAWHVGERLAAELIERYLRDEGRYPESVGLSIWGTSAMRTHGDDVAQVFALLGVRPSWQPENRRLLGVEVIPLAELGRPRIDVVCRISGFFRDAFPHLIKLLDEAVRAVAELDEPPEQNFVRKRYLEERARHLAAGLGEAEARGRALYRVFGCKPGTYGAGILPLIDERNWQGSADFAEAYVNWGGYAYTADRHGVDARDDFRAALGRVVVAAKNQDNREHDIFDSDDYLQYHGGMIATIRALTGKLPRRYFGDSADPARPRVRDLREEALRVFRSRVVNPKWLASMERHGYKGALELAATVDYLFGYDATAEVVQDWMWERVAEVYALDPERRAFFARSNPWALRGIAERLLEAAERRMWEHPAPGLIERLRAVYLETDGWLEDRQA